MKKRLKSIVREKVFGYLATGFGADAAEVI
jgi:hypothetical protein